MDSTKHNFLLESCGVRAVSCWDRAVRVDGLHYFDHSPQREYIVHRVVACSPHSDDTGFLPVRVGGGNQYLNGRFFDTLLLLCVDMRLPPHTHHLSVWQRFVTTYLLQTRLLSRSFAASRYEDRYIH